MNPRTIRRIGVPIVAASLVASFARAGQNAAAGQSTVSTPVEPAVITRDARRSATVRLAEPIRVDGQLDEGVYQSIPAISDFIQT